jgi:hypothetical protein
MATNEFLFMSLAATLDNDQSEKGNPESTQKTATRCTSSKLSATIADHEESFKD